MAVLKKAITGATKSINNDVKNGAMFGWHQPGGTFRHYKSDAYASAYPSIKAIANEFMVIQPYSIDENGEPVDSTVIDRLYHPNKRDSSVAFREKLAVMNLVHRKTYLLVWRVEGGKAAPGGKLTPDNIAGYTFLEYPVVTRADGKTRYSYNGRTYTDDEVIVIPGGVDPHNLDEGYSPSEAGRRWMRLDDYIADYQAGFFENGAVPGGQFLITAATDTEYNDIVDTLQARHRGAARNNNITYSHRPIDPNSGKPADAQIEWIPFSQTNKDLALKDMFEQANKRIDSVYGVPASIRGVGENNNYATAQTDQQNFIRNVVKPVALKIWTQFTHELNRITGGLGVAIAFKLDIPAIADEEKVQAEKKQIEANIITKMVEAGYSLDSIVDAFQLSNSYKLLDTGNKPPVIDNDKPDVDTGNEVGSAPDPAELEPVKKTKQVSARDYPIVYDDTGIDVDDLGCIMAKVEKASPKPAYSKNKKPSEENQAVYKQRLANVIRQHMERQIDKALEDTKVVGDATLQDVEIFTKDMLEVIVAAMVAEGTLEYAAGLQLLIAAGMSTEGATEFLLSQTAVSSYQAYLTNVAKSYSEDTAAAIRSILAQADQGEWTRAQLQAKLRGIMNTDEWRVTRLAVSEINRSLGIASLESMTQIQNETGVQIMKRWNTSSSDPCPYCAALNGMTKPIGEPFVGKGDTIVGADGTTFINDFVPAETCDLHPHDHCYLTYEVVRG